MGLDLSYKYLEVIIKCQNAKKFDLLFGYYI